MSPASRVIVSTVPAESVPQPSTVPLGAHADPGQAEVEVYAEWRLSAEDARSLAAHLIEAAAIADGRVQP